MNLGHEPPRLEKPRRLEARVGRLVRRLLDYVLPGDRAAGTADWQKTLLSYVQRYEPTSGQGPFPTAILLHGCGGDFRHLESWGRFLASRGILAYTIDSLGPRGLGILVARCLVCTGLRLRGRDRSRDITTILPVLRADPKVDPERLHLLGWSHGGWTVTEWMLDAEAAARDRGWRVCSIVLVYPYCGILSRIHEKPWTARSAVLVVTGEADRIVPNDATRAFMKRLAENGVPLTHVAIAGVGHAFDVSGTSGFDAAKAAELQAGVIAFLHGPGA